MRKVFIADPALKDLRGHHFNLTLTMTRALESEDCKVICLANKAFKENCELDVERCFVTDTYDLHKAGVPSAGEMLSPIAKSGSIPNGLMHRAGLILLRPSRAIEILRRWSKRLPTPVRRLLSSVRSAVGRLSPNASARRLHEPLAEPPLSDPVLQLLLALKKRGASGKDHLLFHTSDGETYRDVVRLFVSCVPVEKWGDVPRIHLSTPYDESIMPHNKTMPDAALSVRRLRNLGLLGERVVLHAENELLAQHLASRFSLAVRPLCIPAIPIRIEAAQHNRLRVGYLGPARTEKGFAKIPKLVAETIAKNVELEFIVQVTPQILGYTSEIRTALDELLSLEYEHLRIIEQPLSSLQYEEILGSLDVVLLNYEPAQYRVRSSGIAVEAVVAGKNLIVTPDTFPAYIAGDAGVGVSFEESAIEALQRISADRDLYQERASARRNWYLESHSSRDFAEALIQATSGSESQHGTLSNRYHDPGPWQRLIS